LQTDTKILSALYQLKSCQPLHGCTVGKYNFPLVLHYNYIFILHRFLDIITYSSKLKEVM